MTNTAENAERSPARHTMSCRHFWFWIYLAGFLGSVVGFLVDYYADDVQGMIFYGFAGMLWYGCVERESSK